MRIINAVSIEEVREKFHYDPETGIFIHLRSSGRGKAGAEAGSLANGYRDLQIGGRNYKAHRIAWLLMTGEWPVILIDHINGVRDDNRFCNLREATFTENTRNAKLKSCNSSGVKGVCWSSKEGKWVVHVRYQGRKVRVGCFLTLAEAQAASHTAIAFCHGEFARLS